MTQVECSCGVPGCPEKGWPHEWDPIAAGDDCTIGGTTDANPHHFARYIGGGRYAEEPAGHKVSAPYVRHGSGYACESFVGPER